MGKIVTKFNMGHLNKAYKEHGVLSVEFYEVLEKFIYFVQYRYMGKKDEEVFWKSYSRIIESMSYYTGDIHIASWVYSIVRNQISAHFYQLKKERNQIREGLEMIQAPPGRNTYVGREHLEESLTGFHEGVEIKIKGNEGPWDLLELPDLLKRTYLWSQMKISRML